MTGSLLIVDDDVDLQQSLSDVLTDEGYDVACANDGVAALDRLHAAAPPCLIILDWMMPRCDGATFRARQLADPNPMIRAIPVVLLTADPNIDAKSLALDAVAYLRKPVDLPRMFRIIRAHC